MVYIISLGNEGKGMYATGPERRLYVMEASKPEKEKRRVSTVVVYTFFFPASVENFGEVPRTVQIPLLSFTPSTFW